MPDAPIVQTQRLTLRAHRANDLRACRKLWSDAGVIRHIGGVPQDRQAVWFRILRYAGMWSLLGYGMWAIEDRATGAFLGEAGLLSAARGVPELNGVPEAGWVLGPDAWGKGFATEAMGAVLAWADGHLDAPSIRCIIEPANVGSIRVAEKLGFQAFAETSLGADMVSVFDRRRQGVGKV